MIPVKSLQGKRSVLIIVKRPAGSFIDTFEGCIIAYCGAFSCFAIRDAGLLSASAGLDELGVIAIIKLTKLVCVTFKHSAVFRIGGDEFVAVLRNDDFINRDKLTAEMYRAFDEMEEDPALSPW